MKKLFDALDGKKTYIGMAAWGIYNIMIQLSPGLANTISPDIVNTALTAWIGISFRDALKKME